MGRKVMYRALARRRDEQGKGEKFGIRIRREERRVGKTVKILPKLNVHVLAALCVGFSL